MAECNQLTALTVKGLINKVKYSVIVSAKAKAETRYRLIVTATRCLGQVVHHHHHCDGRSVGVDGEVVVLHYHCDSR